MAKATVANAKLDRIGIRARMDHRPRALAAAPLVMRIRQLLATNTWACATAPASHDSSPADTDDKKDGPATRHALGCHAQRLFMVGDYAQLDALMREHMGTLEDLPDGSSSYEGLVDGLASLFRFGGLDAEVALGHTADWRRRVKDSTIAELVEVMIFTEWAWSARGNGYAAAALDEVADRAANNPLWYTLSLEVGLDPSTDREKLQAIFDQGVEKVPKYRPIYRCMLRILMPRWGGSYDDEDKFINQIDAKTASTRGYERYAELYSAYARLEGDELDFFTDTRVFWNGMRTGYLALLKRYPKSDAVLNSFANFACRADDRLTYGQLRGEVAKRLSSTAWPTKYSMASCDKKLAAVGQISDSRALKTPLDEQSRVLGGARLGMTQKDLVVAKGNPVLRRGWYRGKGWFWRSPIRAMRPQLLQSCLILTV
jgi:hypothetical protein